MKKAIVSGLIAMFVMSLMVGFLVSSASATWCNNDYGKKAPILINNTGGSEQTYYQVMLNYTYDSDMNANFSDMRIYNESDCSLVSLWNESAVPSSYNTIWGNYSNIPASSWCNDTYYLYYGNAAASSNSNITTTFLFGDDFEEYTSTEVFTIESTKAIGNYSCHGCPVIANHSADEYWVSWHYNPDDLSGDTLPENITKMVLYTNNNTNSSLSWITQESQDQEMPSQIEKLGDTYYTFFSHCTGGVNIQPFTVEYKNSSDGVTWNGPYSLGTSSTKRPGPKLMKINDTIWWIVYTDRNATASSVRYIQFNATSGVFGSETDIVASSTANWLYQPFGLYDLSTDKYFIYYYQATTHDLYVVNKTGDSGAWSSPTEIINDVGSGYIAPWVIKWNSQFFLFYYDGNYDIKVMNGTDGVSFSALQTLYSDASDWYWYPTVAPINSTHLVMVYSWYGSASERIIYWDILKYNPDYENKWDETGSPDSVTTANSIVDITKTADSWGGISTKTSYGVYNIAYRAKVKYAGTKTQSGMSNVFPDMFTAADTINFVQYTTDPIRYCTINDGTRTFIEGVEEHDNYHVDEAKWKSGEVKLYRDGVLKAIHTTDIPDEAMKVGLIARTSHIYADWILIRKYASPEPTALLGSEQTANGGGGDASVTVTDGSIIFGDLQLSNTKDTVTLGDTQVINTTGAGGNQLIEIKLNSSTVTGTTNSTDLTFVSGSPGQNQLRCQFKGGDVGSYTALTTSYQEFDSSMANNTNANLDIQLTMPSSVSSDNYYDYYQFEITVRATLL